ncbi:hypothetical protein ON010_g9545 [Phytophthora cinnamomi]|nr:hypothetical protein ON010_g9545 [Phytophthora cinnamomi]
MPGNQAPAATAPRARGGDSRRVPAPQQQDRLGCEPATVWSPASPSFASSDLLSTSFTDAIEEAAVLSSPAMQRAIGKSAANYLHHSSSNSSGAVKSEPRADDHAMMAAAPPYELDRDMMGMLANNWNLNAAPPRAPTANWGFEPTPYDSEALMTSASNQPAPLAGSMMMTPPTSADMTHMMGLAGSEPSFASGGVMTNNNTGNNAQQSMSRSAATSLGPDPFSAMDNFVMPYQDCATLPVSDYPLYDDGGIYKPAFDSAGTRAWVEPIYACRVSRREQSSERKLGPILRQQWTDDGRVPAGGQRGPSVQ